MRCVKVPVKFGRMEFEHGVLVGAFIKDGPKSVSTNTIGYGSTEEEALADLRLKLGCEGEEE